LAHELGHLMGQAHDRDNAEDAGVHTYSYGYRESSSTGFHTIMAYPASQSQVEAPHFANPSVRFSNRPTGTDTENNVRSMNQTMPVVAGFRDTVVPVPGKAPRDVEGDGDSELLWRRTNSATENFRFWRIGANGAVSKSAYFSFSNRYQ